MSVAALEMKPSTRVRLKSVVDGVLGRGFATKAFLLLTQGPRYWPIRRYSEISGWLSAREAAALFNAARALPNDDAVVVEIGSFLGKSSVCLAKGLAGKPSARLVCVDPFNADGDPDSVDGYRAVQGAAPLSLRERFMNNLRRNGVEDRVTVLQGYSHDVRPKFNDPVDLLFIDGNHEYDAVLRDYLDWSPLVRPGGWVAFHDADKPGPRSVVDQYVRTEEWTDLRVAHSLVLARRRGA